MADNGYLLGLDIGSSSVKASLMDALTGKVVGSATSPKTEMNISAPKPGWAEQAPELWWSHVKKACADIEKETKEKFARTSAIGISYQMHGLVLVDKQNKVLRPSIIWCDSRAVPYGQKAFREIGKEICLARLLNSPGNFTAAKLAWVKENEPEIYKRINKFMLPGDY
ncbi:MAG: FGGY family carbohydrate kinase, partial [Spirochaetota bacterium]